MRQYDLIRKANAFVQNYQKFEMFEQNLEEFDSSRYVSLFSLIFHPLSVLLCYKASARLRSYCLSPFFYISLFILLVCLASCCSYLVSSPSSLLTPEPYRLAVNTERLWRASSTNTRLVKRPTTWRGVWTRKKKQSHHT